MLQTQSLCFSYDENEILHNIDLRIGSGLTVLLGPNGCGKTTLLRLLCGHLRPNSGKALLLGQNVHSMPAKKRARLLAYVAQNSFVQADMTVYDTVLLGRYAYTGLLKSPGAQDTQAVKNAMQLCGVDNLAQRSVLHLSGGELRRVLLARALAQQSNYLLLDEPVTGLDVRYQLELMELLTTLGPQKNMVVVLHDLELAARYAQTIVLLRQGHVVATGTPEAVLTPENLAAVYGIEGELLWVNGLPFVKTHLKKHVQVL